MLASLVQTFVVLAVIVSAAFAADPALGTYNVDDQITVSGLSSGGFMAVQTHVAFSGTIKGAAVFAGGPYYCAQGDVTTAQYVCMSQTMGNPNVNTYITYTDKAASAGKIDTTKNLADDKIFLFSGSVDSTVKPIVMKTLLSYYQNYNNVSSNIATEFDLKAEHCLPTLDYGEACTVKKSPYIGKCDYDGAGIALSHLYGPLASGKAVSSHLTTFDQSPFVTKSSSLGNTGYIYVPAACADGKTKCKLHISFHGCVQDLSSIGNQYAEDTGFNSWAEANNIIVLYPYAVSSVNPSNPNACWDWWGYTGSDYVYQTGKQMKFVKDLIDHITGGAPTPDPSPTLAPAPSPAPVTVPTAPPVVKPTLPPASPSPKPTYAPSAPPSQKPTSSFACQEWTACVWDHYTAKRAVFSENYTHYACKGSLQDLGLTGYCGGAVGNDNPVTVKMTADSYYELGHCPTN